MRIQFAIGAALVASVIGTTAALSAIELPPGPNRELVYGQCRTCHDLQYVVESAGLPRNAWNDLLDSMRQYGLRIPEDQRGKILDYLSAYLGPNPPKPAGAPGAAVADASGEKIFKEQCVSCHQASGKGLEEQFPPLAGNSDLYLARDFPVRVLLHGLEGRIEVEGNSFDSVMPPFDHLSNGQITAVLHYIRTAWDNGKLAPADFAAVTETDVKQARSQEMSPEDVWKYRDELQTPDHAPKKM